ncbi:MAG TPA: hypothetical protein DCQ98_18125 [Planctomycetaceae bacterium]|nr:hypothetical protein [Planctomycetaceae bacterium]HRF02402.1 hypothetical protein [Pirellulaceae bacterium]
MIKASDVKFARPADELRPPTHAPPGPIASFLHRAFWIGIAMLTIGLLLIGSLWQASQVEPEFYREALERSDESEVQGNAELLSSTAQVAEKIDGSEPWELTVTEAQVNGWLALELPDLLAQRGVSGVEEPRCRIDENGIRLACRWSASGIGGVLVLHCYPVLDAEHEALAIELRGLKSGLLPVPRRRWLEPLRRATDSPDLPIRWTTDADPPRIIVALDRIETRPGRVLSLERFELADGALELAGSSRPLDD